jgi:hypothetical protein
MTLHRIAPVLLGIGLLLEVLVLGYSAWESQGDSTKFFQAAARLSGRVSLLFFVLLVVQVTYAPNFDRNSLPFKVKFLLFRDFAIVHVIHWCLLAVAVYLSGFELVPVRLLGGAIAYGLVVGMPFLMARRNISDETLMRVQSAYLYWVALVFLLTYVTRLRGQVPTATGSMLSWWIGLGVLVLLFLWRIGFLWNVRKNAVLP